MHPHFVFASVMAGVGLLLAASHLLPVAKDIWDWAGRDSRNLQGPLLAALVAVAVFLLTKMLDLILRWRDRVIMRRRLVLGLYAEIESNLAEIEEFVQVGPDGEASDRAIRPVIEAILSKEAPQAATPPATTSDKKAAGETADAVYRPLIVITESNRFFLASAALVPELKTAVLLPLMEFYRALDELEKRRSAIESKGYETVSVASRTGAIWDLWNTGNAARAYGLHTLREFRTHYSEHWFAELAEAKTRMPKPGRRYEFIPRDDAS